MTFLGLKQSGCNTAIKLEASNFRCGSLYLIGQFLESAKTTGVYVDQDLRGPLAPHHVPNMYTVKATHLVFVCVTPGSLDVARLYRPGHQAPGDPHVTLPPPSPRRRSFAAA